MIDNDPDPRDGAGDVTPHNVAAAIIAAVAIVTVAAIITIALINVFAAVVGR